MKYLKCKTSEQIISELKIKLRSSKNLAASIKGENEQMRTALKRISVNRANRYESTVGIMADIADACLKSVSPANDKGLATQPAPQIPEKHK